MATLPTGYSAAQDLVAAASANSKGTDVFPTMGGFGPGVTIQQMRDFFSTNPNNDQILQQASRLGMGQEEVARALVYGRGDRLDDMKTNEMINGSSNYGYDNSGRIVALNGRGKSEQNGSSALTVNGGGMGGGNLGMGGNSGANYGAQGGSMAGGQNPYLADMGKVIVDQMQENYTRNQAPLARSGAMAAGGFGGSRQGVVEANGLNDLNRGIGQNLTNLYGTDWTNQQNRNLQNKSIDNSYDLGIRSNNLGFANLDSNNQQFGANYGINLLNAQNNWAQQGVQMANGMQNAPVDYARYFQGQANQTAGQGGTTTNSQTNPGNPYIGAIGGAQLVNSWLK